MAKDESERATEGTTEAGGEEGDQRSESLIVALAGRGEETAKRVYGELSDNPRMQDARERLGKVSHSVLSQLNIASRDEIEALREDNARLEQRLAALEKRVAKSRPADRKDTSEE
jgi:BMFP domain-containing protein YqiC